MSFAIWITGLSGAGKTTLGEILQKKLCGVLIDGDRIRKEQRHIPKHVDPFSRKARSLNVTYAATLAKEAIDNGVPAIVSLISPYKKDRIRAFDIIEHRCLLVYLECPIYELRMRDPKGLYRQAFEGDLKNLSGVNDPYEVPVGHEENPVTINTSIICENCAARIVLDICVKRGILTQPSIVSNM
jgi:adenylylsulfate kinase-like enzyme